MNLNTIRDIIKKEIIRKGYQVEERKSIATDSWYYKIYNGDNSLLFRISDHNTKSNVVTLRIDKKINKEKIEAFVRNRCDGLSRRVIDDFFRK